MILIKDLPSIIKTVRLMDVSENQLDIEMSDYWTRDTEKEYNKVTNQLDKLTSKGKGYEIYVWYDISGYDYWVLNMKEENYAQISIRFDGDTFKPRQIQALVNKIERVIDKVNSIIYY